MKKWLVILALVGAPVVGAKSYDITLWAPTMVRNVQLSPGDYHVKLDGSNAIFTDASGNHYKMSVNVEQAAKKFDETEVQTTKAGGQDHIDEIRLSGTRMKLEFN